MLGEFQSSVSADTYHNDVVVVRDTQSYNGIRPLPKAWTRGLGYRVLPMTQQQHQEEEMELTGGNNMRTPIIAGSSGGDVMTTKSLVYNDNRMRKHLSKTNQKYLQGGRI